jgi:F-type H+-transporting ATPase subunit b
LISFKRSNCIPSLILSAVLLGTIVAPVSTLHAQSAPAATADQSQPTEAQPARTGTAAKTDAKPETKSEAEETNVYRHSATVQWFAKLLNIDVELAAKAFEYINFAIIVLAIGIPLFKILPKVLRKRSETLSHELQSAHAATESANARLSAVEARMAGLDTEIGAIRKQVEEDIREDEARIKASIGEETARIVAAAEQEIGVAAVQAQRELKQYVADLAIDRALKQLTLNADTDRALFAEFARDSKGDQN